MNPVAQLRQPEYTGESRCLPCTATNVVIAAVVSGLVAAVSLSAGVGLFALSLVAIWLRGYLVPGTPELTKRYFPDRLLALFDKEPESAAGLASVDDEEPVRDVDPESVLLRAGAVEPCEHEDDLCLTDDFREAWSDRWHSLRADGADREALAERLAVDADDLRFTEHDDGLEAFEGERRVGQWESRAALLADLGAAAELPDRLDDWDRHGVGAKARVLGGLRVFLEHCPVCDGDVVAGTEVVESCCRSHEVVAVGCDDCEARLLEVPFTEA